MDLVQCPRASAYFKQVLEGRVNDHVLAARLMMMYKGSYEPDPPLLCLFLGPALPETGEEICRHQGH
jgi:hypothetical protein